MAQPGGVTPQTLTPCGEDCIHWHSAGTSEADLHLQGDSWVGTRADTSGMASGDCTITLTSSLQLTSACPSKTYVWQLTKNG
jgi:hypothetical protein